MLPKIDIIGGGFPCQDLSVAGAGKGLDGERSGLFFEIVRLIRECNPRFVFLENVPAIRTRGGERVVKELASIGYDCRWTTLSASAVGAPHKRERWFLLAHTKRKRCGARTDELENGPNGRPSDFIGDTGTASGIVAKVRKASIEFDWATEPDVGRVANGIPDRAHRIKCLGNSVVPLQVREAFKKLSGLNFS
jgi:DNA (cytosine-5)-methyltransferase 1